MRVWFHVGCLSLTYLSCVTMVRSKVEVPRDVRNSKVWKNTSLGDIGIKTHARPQVGQDQVSGEIVEFVFQYLGLFYSPHLQQPFTKTLTAGVTWWFVSFNYVSCFNSCSYHKDVELLFNLNMCVVATFIILTAEPGRFENERFCSRYIY